jgi:hypothetical protein
VAKVRLSDGRRHDMPAERYGLSGRMAWDEARELLAETEPRGGDGPDDPSCWYVLRAAGMGRVAGSRLNGSGVALAEALRAALGPDGVLGGS